MSLRTLFEDAAYSGTGLLGSALSRWRSVPSTARRMVLVVLAVMLLLLLIGPRLGLFDGPRGGLTDEELRLIERAGTASPSPDTLPWWYQRGG